MNSETVENGLSDSIEHKDHLKPPPKGFKRGKGVYLWFASQEEANQAVLNFWRERNPTVVERIESGGLSVDTTITEGPRTEPGPLDGPHKAQGYSHAIIISDNWNPLSEPTINAIRNLGYDIEDL